MKTVDYSTIASLRTCSLCEETGGHKLGRPPWLECPYASSQRVYVTWKKEKKLIWPTYQYNVKTNDSSCTLEVFYSNRAVPAGKYNCEISNTEGAETCQAHVNFNLVVLRLLGSGAPW